MKKRFFLLLSSMLIFTGLLFLNLKQAHSVAAADGSSISLLELNLSPSLALAESGCVEGDGNGGVIVTCGYYFGCCHICVWNPWGDNYCDWTGSPSDYCAVDYLGAC